METPYTLDQVDTRCYREVAAEVAEIARQLYGVLIDEGSLKHLFAEVADMFAGRFVYFQPMDVGYHNLEHTLQATLCWARLTRNFVRHGDPALITADYFEIGLAAILLHDVGYLKEEHDAFGSGAKFTFVHERRSCELAQIFLGQRGWTIEAILAVQHIISCTGPRASIDSIPFRHPAERVLGQMVCTADYIGQLSDPAYLKKLPVLYLEFEESDRFRGIPPEKRPFRSVEELFRRTPAFWFQEVLPRLEEQCDALYRYLAEPFPDGPNPYLAAVEENLARIGEQMRLPLA